MNADQVDVDDGVGNLRGIAASVLGAHPAQIEFRLRPPLDIQSNHLFEATYRSQHIILKEFLKPEEFGESPLREFRALQLLAPLEIAPIPRTYIPPQAGYNPVVVYDYMPGEMWDRQKPTAEELKQLAYLWLRMNEVDNGSLWLSRGQSRSLRAIWRDVWRGMCDYVNWAKDVYPEASRVSHLCLDLAEGCSIILGRLEALPPMVCFCKSDPRFANVIRRPNGSLGLVDWEDCGMQDPALELADVLNHPNQEDLLTQGEWQPLLDVYLEGRRAVDPCLEDRFELYSALLPIWWLSILLKEGMRRQSAEQLRSWRVHGMDPNQKLRRYLVRALATEVHRQFRPSHVLGDAHFFPL